ncbi:hypothetical protein VTK26DRAFT_5424 [Humicola hyalothermophila]
MSGSPPLPPKTSHDVAERGQGTYQSTTQDVLYRGSPTTQGEQRTPASPAGVPPPFLSDSLERPAFPPLPREEPTARPLPYPRPFGQPGSQPPPYLPIPGPGTPSSHPGSLATLQTYSATSSRITQEPHHNPPVKPQRKAKGHVASACVPCKKAHLRCDAQRPCSRCLSNNKEAACVDVQHKKRGRPRLRDENQTKFDGSRFGAAADVMRRPLSSTYGSGPSLGMIYEDSLRRTPSYRVLKSQLPESTAPRFLERGLASDANVFPAPLSISTARSSEEAVAYLTFGLEFSRASGSFLNAVCRSSVMGFRLVDVLAPEERSKAMRLQQQAQEEQTRKEPAYLPPIFNERSEIVFQSLGFTPEEVSRYPLHWLDTFTFVGDDGQGRPFPIRAGLAKRDSIYFVVLSLNRTHRPSYPTPSPSLREMGASFEPALQYSQMTPLSATFDPRQSRLSDAGFEAKRSGTPVPPHHAITGRSPGLPLPTFATSPSRADYPTAPNVHQTPRTEAHTSRSAQPSEYQLLPLPRIRSPPPVASRQQPEPPPPSLPPLPPPQPPYQAREDRSRIGIGGLLEQTDPTKKA